MPDRDVLERSERVPPAEAQQGKADDAQFDARLQDDIVGAAVPPGIERVPYRKEILIVRGGEIGKPGTEEPVVLERREADFPNRDAARSAVVAALGIGRHESDPRIREK